MEHFTIAIDGPGGAGKSTVAKNVAAKLNVLHLDTGAMYRAFAWQALSEGLSTRDAEALSALAGRITSIAWSPSLKRHVGLAFIRPDLSAVGTPFQIRLTDGRLVQATVCATPFYDPNNLKQKEGA